MKNDKVDKVKDIKCPLCFHTRSVLIFEGDKRSGQREFYNCLYCDLVYTPKKYLPECNTEKIRYEEHNNDIADYRYRKFLSKLTNEIKPFINKKMKGLDYGSGPQPALAEMMREEGYDVKTYDPFFHPDTNILSLQFDFITCTEVVEHFHNPKAEFDKLFKMLKTNGVLGIMTEIPDDWKDFDKWYYKNDITHVVFYSMKTMEYIAKQYKHNCFSTRKNVVIFTK